MLGFSACILLAFAGLTVMKPCNCSATVPATKEDSMRA